MLKVLQWFDGCCRWYLGLEKKSFRLHAVTMMENKLIFVTRDANKRYYYPQTWDDFIACHARELTREDKNKLGILCGEAIASNLVVIFDDLEESKHEIGN